MTRELSVEIGKLLLAYVGPETDRVRTAIVKLAKDDLDQTRHYVECAQEDYRDILWRAQLQEEEEKNKPPISGMSVNERLSYLHLMQDWDCAVAHRDRDAASAILKRCDLTLTDIQGIIDAAFKDA